MGTLPGKEKSHQQPHPGSETNKMQDRTPKLVPALRSTPHYTKTPQFYPTDTPQDPHYLSPSTKFNTDDSPSPPRNNSKSTVAADTSSAIAKRTTLENELTRLSTAFNESQSSLASATSAIHALEEKLKEKSDFTLERRGTEVPINYSSVPTQTNPRRKTH